MAPSGAGARREADRHLAAGFVDDPVVQRDGRVGDQLPVLTPEREPAGWMVPVTIGAALAGFFQFDAALTMLRYSSTLRRRGAIDGAPAALTWLDPGHAVALARSLVPNGRPAEPPWLTFDGNITRLVWSVALVEPDGRTTTVFVAGEYPYRRPPSP